MVLGGKLFILTKSSGFYPLSLVVLSNITLVLYLLTPQKICSGTFVRNRFLLAIS